MQLQTIMQQVQVILHKSNSTVLDCRKYHSKISLITATLKLGVWELLNWQNWKKVILNCWKQYYFFLLKALVCMLFKDKNFAFTEWICPPICKKCVMSENVFWKCLVQPIEIWLKIKYKWSTQSITKSSIKTVKYQIKYQKTNRREDQMIKKRIL